MRTTLTRSQATTFRRALLRAGFDLVLHGPVNGSTVTRLDGPGVAVVLWWNDERTSVHVHWRTGRLNRSSESIIDRAEAEALTTL